jgi:prolipoprotein diacylglyceryltransferase
MPEVLSVGDLVIPTLRTSLLLSLLLAPWLVGRFATRRSLDADWIAKVAENAVWLGLIGAGLGFVIANSSTPATTRIRRSTQSRVSPNWKTPF